MTSDNAITWIHERVGINLDGNASLDECAAWIRNNGSEMDRHLLDWHILPFVRSPLPKAMSFNERADGWEPSAEFAGPTPEGN